MTIRRKWISVLAGLARFAGKGATVRIVAAGLALAILVVPVLMLVDAPRAMLDFAGARLARDAGDGARAYPVRIGFAQSESAASAASAASVQRAAHPLRITFPAQSPEEVRPAPE